jgi:hypothetical protein
MTAHAWVRWPQGGPTIRTALSSKEIRTELRIFNPLLTPVRGQLRWIPEQEWPS